MNPSLSPLRQIQNIVLSWRYRRSTASLLSQKATQWVIASLRLFGPLAHWRPVNIYVRISISLNIFAKTTLIGPGSLGSVIRKPIASSTNAMQFEVLATCNTTRARVSRMKLARKCNKNYTCALLSLCRWRDDAANIHARRDTGRHKGAHTTADGGARRHTHTEQHLPPQPPSRYRSPQRSRRSTQVPRME